MYDDGLEPERKRKIIGILHVLFPQGVKIYLYGSRAMGKFRERSDIILAIDAGERVEVFEEAYDAVAAVVSPYKLDLVDLHRTSKSFKEEIMKYAVEWKQ